MPKDPIPDLPRREDPTRLPDPPVVPRPQEPRIDPKVPPLKPTPEPPTRPRPNSPEIG